ncbi:hypothetical protein BDR26DRAFT_849584 [Obelidium mucronatum]|nr:hypothetical protein BDR26DRAFT_849584 [Obelidium mucronatum]
MMTAESSIAIPYARGDNAVEAIVSRLQQKCDITSQVKAVKGSDTLSLKDSKIFVSELMTFAGSLSNQQVAASTNDETMTSLIEQIKSLTSNHVVIFTSSKPAGQGLARRSVGSTVSSSTTNSTFVPFKDRTFLQKYVLFNMGVFEGSISLFLVSFVSLIGVNLLRSVQTPTKFEEPARH